MHPTPVLLPGKSHGRRSLEAAVHGVAEGRTQLSDFTFAFHFHTLEREMATHSSILALRIPGMGELGGLPSMGSHRVGHDWSDLVVVVVVLKGNAWTLDQSCPCLQSASSEEFFCRIFSCSKSPDKSTPLFVRLCSPLSMGCFPLNKRHQTHY